MLPGVSLGSLFQSGCSLLEGHPAISRKDLRAIKCRKVQSDAAIVRATSESKRLQNSTN